MPQLFAFLAEIAADHIVDERVGRPEPFGYEIVQLVQLRSE